MVMERLADEVRERFPWTVMFMDPTGSRQNRTVGETSSSLDLEMAAMTKRLAGKLDVAELKMIFFSHSKDG